MEYGAIDLHLKRSLIRIVDERGQVVYERTVPTSADGFRQVFVGRSPMRVLLETGTESEWVAQTVEAYGHAVVVADPNYALMYGHRPRRVKTDRRDVAALAEACRLGSIGARIGCRRHSGKPGGRCECASSWCGCGRKRSICCARSSGRRGIGCHRAVRRPCRPGMRA